MTPLEPLRRVVDAFEELDVPYMIVGSLAMSLYGRPRIATQVDVVVSLKLDDVPSLAEKLPDSEFQYSPESIGQAVRTNTQFNIIHPASGNKIDVMMVPDSLWGEMQMQRRQRKRIFADREAYVARPEDIILSKMQYYKEGGSEKHLRDITGMLKISPEEIDRRYITEWAAKLGVADVWQAILRRLGLAG